MDSLRVLVTGCSGYIGGLLLPSLLAHPQVELVVGVDRRPPPLEHPRLQVVLQDITHPLGDLLRQWGTQTVLHLAFVLTPTRRGAAAARRTNVEGSRQVLEACAAAGVSHVVWFSSTAAYGAHPDNPDILTEESPLRPVPGFPYSRDKAETDAMARGFAAQNPQVAVAVLRGCPVVGPHGGSAVAGWFTKPFLPHIPGTDPPMQFIHEEDLTDILLRCLLERVSGVFNVAGEGALRYSEVARLLGKPMLPLPARLLHPVTTALWRLGLSGVATAPGAGIDFIRYPWVVSNGKIKSALGLERLRSSREALEAYRRRREAEAAPAG